MTTLDTLRTKIPAGARDTWYRYGGALIVFLGSWGLMDASSVPQWSALVVGAITLLFAALHSTSNVRTSLYLALVAVQGVAGLYGILGDQKWGAILQLAAIVLGVATAASNTPTNYVVVDAEPERVADTELAFVPFAEANEKDFGYNADRTFQTFEGRAAELKAHPERFARE